MTLVGQPPPSPALKRGFELLAAGQPAEAESVVRTAAVQAKARHGSGSPALVRAYGELARLHLRMGRFEQAAKEFQHAAAGPLPAEKQQRQERLSFLLGLAVALGNLGRLTEAEKVLRQCHEFARNLHGPSSPEAAVSLVPLADVLLRAGAVDEALRLVSRAYDTLWSQGDSRLALVVGTRAEALRAAGRGDDPFADLAELPDGLVAAAVTVTATRAGMGDVGRTRAVLADLLAFVRRRYGTDQELAVEVLAAIAHHEEAAGDQGEPATRQRAVCQAVWSFAVSRLPGGLLANLEVAFETDDTLHLVPHLSRLPTADESTRLESVLRQAVDDLYSRPRLASVELGN